MPLRSPHLFLPLAACLALAACTDPMSQRLVVDGPLEPTFAQDEAECRKLVLDQVRVDPDGVVLGSTAGSAAVAAIAKGDAENIVAAAAVGMISGVIAGEQAERNAQRSALVSCMRGRGHKVIS